MIIRDYPTLHLDNILSKGTASLLLFYISVTVSSSMMSIAPTLK